MYVDEFGALRHEKKLLIPFLLIQNGDFCLFRSRHKLDVV